MTVLEITKWMIFFIFIYVNRFEIASSTTHYCIKSICNLEHNDPKQLLKQKILFEIDIAFVFFKKCYIPNSLDLDNKPDIAVWWLD